MAPVQVAVYDVDGVGGAGLRDGRGDEEDQVGRLRVKRIYSTNSKTAAVSSTKQAGLAN